MAVSNNSRGHYLVALYAGSIQDATLLVATDDPNLVNIVKTWFDSNEELECIAEAEREAQLEHIRSVADRQRGRDEGDGSGSLSARTVALLRLARVLPKPT